MIIASICVNISREEERERERESIEQKITSEKHMSIFFLWFSREIN